MGESVFGIQSTEVNIFHVKSQSSRAQRGRLCSLWSKLEKVEIH